MTVKLNAETFKCVRPTQPREVLRIVLEEETLTTIFEYLAAGIKTSEDVGHNYYDRTGRYSKSQKGDGGDEAEEAEEAEEGEVANGNE